MPNLVKWTVTHEKVPIKGSVCKVQFYLIKEIHCKGRVTSEACVLLFATILKKRKKENFSNFFFCGVKLSLPF